MKMNRTIIALCVVSIGLLTACGGGSNESTDTAAPPPKSMVEEEADPMENIGIGPVSSITLTDVDAELAATGQKIFDEKCTACHRVEKKFIGPSPKGILERRNPAWVMNMILNPEEMTQKDPIAKQLFVEANGAPMANQNLTQDEARAVLEYFRTL